MTQRLPVIVLATRNPGKTAEIRELLQGFPVLPREFWAIRRWPMTPG
jgi:hypothetical protein